MDSPPLTPREPHIPRDAQTTTSRGHCAAAGGRYLVPRTRRRAPARRREPGPSPEAWVAPLSICGSREGSRMAGHGSVCGKPSGRRVAVRAIQFSSFCASFPLDGGRAGDRGGSPASASVHTPTPDPSPQGGGGKERRTGEGDAERGSERSRGLFVLPSPSMGEGPGLGVVLRSRRLRTPRPRSLPRKGGGKRSKVREIEN